VHYRSKPTDNEIKIIKEQLEQWCSLNEMNRRIFKIFRNVIKYGDQVFVRDPETFKLFWTEMSKITKVIVNESEGKEPEQYLIKDLNPNFQNLTVTAVAATDTFVNHPQTGGPSGGLIFSIGLVELLTEVDLLNARHVAGTGTINDRGVVGAIGGINEKISSAQKAGATLFFAPVDNAEEIANIPAGIKVITVATLAQAISYLERTSK
jgi:hypothetical protein